MEGSYVNEPPISWNLYEICDERNTINANNPYRQYELVGLI